MVLRLSGIISSPRFCLHPTLLLNDEFSYVHFRAAPGGVESVDRIDEVESNQWARKAPSCPVDCRACASFVIFFSIFVHPYRLLEFDTALRAPLSPRSI